MYVKTSTGWRKKKKKKTSYISRKKAELIRYHNYYAKHQATPMWPLKLKNAFADLYKDSINPQAQKNTMTSPQFRNYFHPQSDTIGQEEIVTPITANQRLALISETPWQTQLGQSLGQYGQRAIQGMGDITLTAGRGALSTAMTPYGIAHAAAEAAPDPASRALALYQAHQRFGPENTLAYTQAAQNWLMQNYPHQYAQLAGWAPNVLAQAYQYGQPVLNVLQGAFQRAMNQPGGFPDAGDFAPNAFG